VQQGSRVIVGRCVTVRHCDPEPSYFTEVHRSWCGKTGRVHAVVATGERDNPLVKVGFDDGVHIVFYRLKELTLDVETTLVNPAKHGVRGSHLP
jgi:hypothetical protein